MYLKRAGRAVRRVWNSAVPRRMLESAQEPEMMTADQPANDAQAAPPGEHAALGEWFDDPDVPEEVQALQAWVAGLSNELADVRRERDGVQQALYTALAEIAQLRRVIAQTDAGLLPHGGMAPVAAAHSGLPDAFSRARPEPGAEAAAAIAPPPAPDGDE